MANISCDVGYSTNVLPRDPSSCRTSSHSRSSPIRVPLNDEGIFRDDDGRVPTLPSNRAPRRIAAFHEEQRNEQPLMFRRDAATRHSRNATTAACVGLKKAHAGKEAFAKSNPLAASLAAVAQHKQAQQRAAGGRSRRHSYQSGNRAVLNDHLLWLELQREVRSKKVFTNVAANVVARRYIHELTQGIEGENDRKANANNNNLSSAGIDLIDNARFFGLMPPAPTRSRDSSAGSKTMASPTARLHARDSARRRKSSMSKVDGILGSSLAGIFDRAGGASSTPSSSLPHSAHSSAGCLTDLLMPGDQQGGTYGDAQAQQVNLKSTEALHAASVQAQQAAARKNSGVGWMMKSLGDSLSRESHCDLNGSMSFLGSAPGYSSSELEEDLLVRASMSTSALSSSSSATAGAAGGDREVYGLTTKKKKRKGSLGSLSASMSYMLDSAAHLTFLHESYCRNELDKKKGYCPGDQELSCLSDGKCCSKEEDGSDEQVDVGYPSIVRAFETLREEDEMGASRRSVAASDSSDHDKEDLLVGFGERPRYTRQSSVFAKTA